MPTVVLILTFVLCSATGFAVLWMCKQAMGAYDTAVYGKYFYYLIAFYTFAFYGVWGQVIMQGLLDSEFGELRLAMVASNLLMVFCLPFLLVSWAMLANLGRVLVKSRARRHWHIILPILLLVVIGIIVAWILNEEESDLFATEALRFGIVAGEGVFVLLVALFVMVGRKNLKVRKRPIATVFAFLIVLSYLLRSTALLIPRPDGYLLAVALLVYFLSGAFPFLYLFRRSDRMFPPIFAESTDLARKTRLFETYGITKREQEIVDKICEGKTNQQIADELFISLQTVKDHTHHIYTKIGIKSRMKLVQILSA